ncbi:serine O-acetyltransferase [Dyadobacter endophyticus]|uniref:serine O-acetyltransferase n=1 Tax=Dyadobacter TaxID=120831 RepID=UPI003CF2B7AC
MSALQQLSGEIKGDLPGGKFILKTFLTNYWYKASFRVLLNHRLGKFFNSRQGFLFKHLALKYRYRLLTRRSCDISYKSSIGKGLRMPHPIGIVIGDGVVIEDNVTLFQQVTLGSHGREGEEMRYPVIERNVKIYTGAKVIGGVRIGENSIVGANSLVNKDVPPNCIAYGVPCKIKEVNR